MFNKIKNKKAIIIITASALILLAIAPWMKNKSIQNDILQKYGRQDGSIDKNGNLFCDYESRWLPFGRWVVSCEGGYFVPFFYIKKGNNDNTQKQQNFENNRAINNTSDWRTYRNEEYGFEFKYPKEWRMQNFDFENFSIVGIDPISINNIRQVDTLPGLISVHFGELWLGKSSIGRNELTKQLEKVKIGEGQGIEAWKMEQQTSDNEPNPTWFNRHILRYHIDYPGNKNKTGKFENDDITIVYFPKSADYEKYLDVFNQILSTFKFTE